MTQPLDGLHRDLVVLLVMAGVSLGLMIANSVCLFWIWSHLR
jgi:hypothetical protein